jgi:hypothetical protein
MENKLPYSNITRGIQSMLHEYYTLRGHTENRYFIRICLGLRRCTELHQVEVELNIQIKARCTKR